MGDVATLLQQHIGHHSKEHSPWRAQAEMFLGLLQNMGSEVPKDKANQTRGYVNQIIDLLTTSSNDIYTDASTTKNTTQAELYEEYAALQRAEAAANAALEGVTEVDGDLATCLTEEKEIAGNHAVHCGEKELPAACVRKNNTKLHTFDVASQDTWKCNFTAGQDPTKCTNPTSSLKQDLVDKKTALRAAYDEWKLQNVTCNRKLTEERELCQSTNNTYHEKKESCDEKFRNASARLCVFRTKIDDWTKDLVALKATQTRAPTLLPPKKKEYTDLNLIICMLKAFRENMTFAESDYGTCEAQAGNLAWVGEIDTKETETEALTTASKYDKECLKFPFSGGLAEEYNANTSITFFAKPKTDTLDIFEYASDGSDGCALAPGSPVAKKVCEDGLSLPK